MYTVRTEDTFAAAHLLKDYHGKCENIHGHNYKVRIYCCGNKLAKGGMLIDFAILKKILKSVLKELDHQNLNEIPFFKKNDPSTELIAEYLFNKIDSKIKEHSDMCYLKRVDVFESNENLAIFTKQDQNFEDEL